MTSRPEWPGKESERDPMVRTCTLNPVHTHHAHDGRTGTPAHAHVDTQTHAYACTHTHTHTHTHTRVRMRTHIRVRTHTCTHTHILKLSINPGETHQAWEPPRTKSILSKKGKYTTKLFSSIKVRPTIRFTLARLNQRPT